MSIKSDLASTVKTIKEYFGIGLPIREIDLEFAVKPPNRRLNRAPIKVSAVREEFQEIGAYATPILTKSRDDLEKLNQCSMKIKKRLRLSKLHLHQSYPHLKRLIAKYKTGGKVPDNGIRAASLDLANETIEKLIYSFQLVFMQCYELPNWRYGGLRNVVAESSFKLFELLAMQQQLSALRYRPLTENHWHAVNKIYHVMDTYENANKSFELTDSALLNSTNKRAKYGNISNLFIEIQIFGFFDPMEYPTQHQSNLYAYIRSQLKHIAVHRMDHVSPVNNQTLVIGHNHKSNPAIVKSIAKDCLPATTINIKNLMVDMHHHYTDVVKAENRGNKFLLKSSFFSKFNERDRLVLVNLLHSSIRYSDDLHCNHDSHKALKLLLYSGLKDCYELKLDDHKPLAERRLLRDKLAARSAFIGEDESAEVESMWYCQHLDDEFIVLQSQETKYTIPMFIGCLMAFSLQSDTTRKHEFGVIYRLERTQNRQVNIHIRKISRYAEALTFTVPDQVDQNQTPGNPEQPNVPDSKSKPVLNKPKPPSALSNQAYPALMLHSGDQWHMLIPHNVGHWGATDIIVSRDRSQYNCQLGNTVLITNEFSIVELSGAKENGFEEKAFVSDSTSATQTTQTKETKETKQHSGWR